MIELQSAIYPLVIIALALGGWAYLIYRQRKKRAAHLRSHHIVPIDGFPTVHIPISIRREQAERFANKLRYTYIKAWAQMIKIYKENPGPLPIATIGSSLSEIDPEHPHVLWIMPGDKILLRIQSSMYHWFAGELHSIFRYKMHGPEWIYETRDKDDAAGAKMVEVWINKRWSKRN